MVCSADQHVRSSHAKHHVRRPHAHLHAAALHARLLPPRVQVADSQAVQAAVGGRHVGMHGKRLARHQAQLQVEEAAGGAKAVLEPLGQAQAVGGGAGARQAHSHTADGSVLH